MTDRDFYSIACLLPDLMLDCLPQRQVAAHIRWRVSSTVLGVNITFSMGPHHEICVKTGQLGNALIHHRLVHAYALSAA